MINKEQRRSVQPEGILVVCSKCPAGISGKSLLGSRAKGEKNKMATLVIILAPLAQQPAEECALYYWFSKMSISEAIFSFPDNLSWNIKDSLTTVNLQLILEWHSDVSQCSLIQNWIHILLCSAVTWIEVYTAQYQTVNLFLSATG